MSCESGSVPAGCLQQTSHRAPKGHPCMKVGHLSCRGAAPAGARAGTWRPRRAGAACPSPARASTAPCPRRSTAPAAAAPTPAGRHASGFQGFGNAHLHLYISMWLHHVQRLACLLYALYCANSRNAVRFFPQEGSPHDAVPCSSLCRPLPGLEYSVCASVPSKHRHTCQRK